MKLLRAKRLWNVCSLLALALWFAPALAWTCPQLGRIAASPEGAMRLADGEHCRAMQAPHAAVQRCPMCPGEAHAVSSRNAAPPAGQCCLRAWLPDSSRFAQRAAAGQAPAVLVHCFRLPEAPAGVWLPRAGAPPLVRRATARAGPSVPRGPPVVWA